MNIIVTIVFILLFISETITGFLTANWKGGMGSIKTLNECGLSGRSFVTMVT